MHIWIGLCLVFLRRDLDKKTLIGVVCILAFSSLMKLAELLLFLKKIVHLYYVNYVNYLYTWIVWQLGILI